MDDKGKGKTVITKKINAKGILNDHRKAERLYFIRKSRIIHFRKNKNKMKAETLRGKKTK